MSQTISVMCGSEELRHLIEQCDYQRLFPDDGLEQRAFAVVQFVAYYHHLGIVFHCDRWTRGGPYFTKNVAVDIRQLPKEQWNGESVARIVRELERRPWRETSPLHEDCIEGLNLEAAEQL